ncbi:MAG: hypothetical protein QM639_05535 [Rhodocyclaceae bacterium]
MTPYNLSFHDSEVASVVAEGAVLTVRLAVAAVRRGPQTGYLPEVRWVFHDARWHGAALAVCVGRLVDGQWQADGLPHRDLPVAGAGLSQGPVAVTLVFQNHEQLHIQAAHAEIHLPDPSRFAESYAC